MDKLKLGLMSCTTVAGQRPSPMSFRLISPHSVHRLTHKLFSSNLLSSRPEKLFRHFWAECFATRWVYLNRSVVLSPEQPSQSDRVSLKDVQELLSGDPIGRLRCCCRRCCAVHFNLLTNNFKNRPCVGCRKVQRRRTTCAAGRGEPGRRTKGNNLHLYISRASLAVLMSPTHGEAAQGARRHKGRAGGAGKAPKTPGPPAPCSNITSKLKPRAPYSASFCARRFL